MTSTRKTLLGVAATAIALGLGTAGTASAWSFGAVTPDAPDRPMVAPNGNTSINFTRNATHDISI
jgi:hypothetical protein